MKSVITKPIPPTSRINVSLSIVLSSSVGRLLLTNAVSDASGQPRKYREYWNCTAAGCNCWREIGFLSL